MNPLTHNRLLFLGVLAALMFTATVRGNSQTHPALAYSDLLYLQPGIVKADANGAVYSIHNNGLTKQNPDGSLAYTMTLPSSMVAGPIAVDPQGAVYLTGETTGNLPTTPGALQTTYGGGASDSFVAKVSPNGNSFVYLTYFGGSSDDVGNGITLDAMGNVYVVGWSSGFGGVPTSVGAFKTVPDNPPDRNVWVAKINSSGNQLSYSTYIGDLGSGSFLGVGPQIALDVSSGSALVTGYSSASTFPYTPGAYNNTTGPFTGTFVTKVNPAGTGLSYSALFAGGSPVGLAVDASGAGYIVGLANAWPTTPGAYETVFPGSDSPALVTFVTKLDPLGANLVYSTWLEIGNSYSHAQAGASAIVLDSAGSAYIAGTTRTPGVHLVNPIQDTLGTDKGNAFVAVLDPQGSALTFATYFGGLVFDILNPGSIDLDQLGNIYLAGNTSGNSFPLTSGVTAGLSSGFVAKIAPSGGPVGVYVPTINASQTWYDANVVQFGNVGAGTTLAPQTIVFGNYGGAVLDILNIAVQGDFSQTNSCPSSLQPGASCQFEVTFSPTQAGVRTGSIVISDNAATGSQQLTLSGTGISASLSVSLPSLSFGPQTTGTSSSPQTITITNSGTWNLTVSGIAVQGDFSETNNCGSPIAPQGTCNIQVVFSPTASGLRQGVLTLTDNAANSPQTIALAGNTDFSLVFAFNSSSSATVVAGQTATYSLNLNTSPGFSGSVALNCTGAPMGANCIVPNSVSGATPSFTVSVSTTAHASARLHDLDHLGSSALLSATALLGMVVLIPPKRKSKRVLLRLKLLPLLLFLVTFLGSCSGGGTMQSSSMGTPAGNYTLTVTGKSGASSSAVALTLTVQ